MKFFLKEMCEKTELVSDGQVRVKEDISVVEITSMKRYKFPTLDVTIYPLWKSNNQLYMSSRVQLSELCVVEYWGRNYKF